LLAPPNDSRRQLVEQGLGLFQVKRQSAKALELRAATSLARLRRDQGKRSEAHDVLAPVYNWFIEGFDTPVLQEAKKLLDQLSADEHGVTVERPG
jgi:predicted ATPase